MEAYPEQADEPELIPVQSRPKFDLRWLQTAPALPDCSFYLPRYRGPPAPEVPAEDEDDE